MASANVASLSPREGRTVLQTIVLPWIFSSSCSGSARGNPCSEQLAQPAAKGAARQPTTAAAARAAAAVVLAAATERAAATAAEDKRAKYSTL